MVCRMLIQLIDLSDANNEFFAQHSADRETVLVTLCDEKLATPIDGFCAPCEALPLQNINTERSR
jgi:hypothetical protein